MEDRKYVCVDLDGTIAHYGGWRGEDHFGEPVAGVQQALGALQGLGWTVIVFTTRGDRAKVAQYLEGHGIPYDDINRSAGQPANATGGKVFAHVYVDDRAIQFNGDWPATLAAILSFRPWEERPAKVGNPKSEPAEFLARDFNQCFAQMRHYDQLMWDAAKFSFLQLFGAIAGAWTIFGFGSGSDNEWIQANWPLGAIALLGISYLFGLLSISLLARLRHYYAKVTRYVNEHRGFFLKQAPLGFANESQMWTDFKEPQTQERWSTQMVSIYAIALADSLVLAAAIGLVAFYAQAAAWVVGVTAAAGYLLSAALMLWVTVRYLKGKGREGAEGAGSAAESGVEASH